MSAPFLSTDDDGKVYKAGIDGDGGGGGGGSLFGSLGRGGGGGGFLLRESGRGENEAGQKEGPERAKVVHVRLDDVGLAGIQPGMICRIRPESREEGRGCPYLV